MSSICLSVFPLRICLEDSRERICTKFGMGVGVADVITCDKFWRSVKGDRICGKSKISGSHWQSLAVTVNTVLPLYRAALDETWTCRAEADSSIYTSWQNSHLLMTFILHKFRVHHASHLWFAVSGRYWRSAIVNSSIRWLIRCQ